jgi:hypothetical protein
MESLNIVVSANRVVARSWEGGECRSQRRFGERETLRVGRNSNRCESDSWALMMGPVVCPETSVRNCHYSLRNNPEKRSSHLLRGGSLKSNKGSDRVKDTVTVTDCGALGIVLCRWAVPRRSGRLYWSSKRLGTAHPTTQRHVTGYCNPQQHGVGTLKTSARLESLRH